MDHRNGNERSHRVEPDHVVDAVVRASTREPLAPPLPHRVRRLLRLARLARRASRKLEQLAREMEASAAQVADEEERWTPTT